MQGCSRPIDNNAISNLSPHSIRSREFTHRAYCALIAVDRGCRELSRSLFSPPMYAERASNVRNQKRATLSV